MNKIIEDDIFNIVSTMPILKQLRGKTILISGANGFLPAYIVDTILYLNIFYLGFDVNLIALVRNKTKAEQRFTHWHGNENFSIIQHDVCDNFQINERIDFIIHAASQASPKYYYSDPVGTLNANLTGTMNLLKLAHRNKVESFLYFSSAEIYGELLETQIPTNENSYGYLDPTDVRSCYAESKRMGENICFSWFHQYGVNSKVVRPFHTYGPGMRLDDGRVFADFVSDCVNEQNIVVKGDGSAKRAFCYLADATKGFLTVLLKGKNGESYNVGNPNEEYSILELANVLSCVNPNLTLKVEQLVQANYKERSNVSRISPSINKISQLGWAPVTSAKEGFSKTITYYQSLKLKS